MKRNNIENSLNNAIENLQTFLYLLSFIPLVNKYKITDVINKNIDIIQHQTNFIEEVDNTIKIKNNCKNLKYVKIPTVYKDVTEKYPNIILMEYIDGIKINEIEKEDYEGFARQVLKFGFVTSMVHGLAHGDLHSGNILFIKDENETKYKYKIGVIDFGIVYDIDPSYKDLAFDVLPQFFVLPPREIAIKILSSSFVDPPNIFQQLPKNHYENILSFATEMMSETVQVSKKANQFQMYKFIHTLNNYLSNSELANIGIRPSDGFVKFQLVLAMSHGVTLTLCKDEFFTLMDNVFQEIFHTDMIVQLS